MSNKHVYGKALIMYNRVPTGVAVAPVNSDPDSKNTYHDSELQPNKGGELSTVSDTYTGVDGESVSDQGASWKVIEWDCVIKETHSVSNEITKYPVQTGFIVADHTIRANRLLSLKGIIVNVGLMPQGVDYAIDLASKAGGALLGSGAGAIIGSIITKARNVFSDTGSSENRVRSVFEELQQLCLKGTIVHASTILGPYVNCVIRDVKVTQDVNTSSVLIVDILLEELQIKGDIKDYSSTIRTALDEQAKTQLQWDEYAKALGINASVVVGGLFGGL